MSENKRPQVKAPGQRRRGQSKDAIPKHGSEFFYLARMTRFIVWGLRSHGNTPEQIRDKVMAAAERAFVPKYPCWVDRVRPRATSGAGRRSYQSMEKTLRHGLACDRLLRIDRQACKRGLAVVEQAMETAMQGWLPDLPMPIWRK
jgi:hypothetical protein